VRSGLPGRGRETRSIPGIASHYNRGMRDQTPGRARALHRPSRWAGLASALLALGGLALASGPAGGDAEVAGELRVGVTRLPDTLDPAAPPTPSSLAIGRQVFQGLVEVGDRGDIAPGLATRWTVSRDGLTWTVHLRPDVQFHDGTPLTADAVAASLARHLGSEEPDAPADAWVRLFRGRGALIREVRRGPGGEVQLQLSQPFSPLLAVLAHPALAIGLPQSGSRVPFLGTGPYRVAEWDGGRLVLEATSLASAPGVARVVFTEVADDAAAFAELGPNGGLDLHFPRTPPAWGGLGLQVLSAPAWRTGYLALRSDQGLLARKPIRQAVSLALDPALTGPALGRAARPHAALLPPGAWAGRPASPPLHDPTRARRLLADGQALGATVTLLVPELEGELEMAGLAEAIRLSLAVAGLTVTVRTEAGDRYLRALRQGESELALHEVAFAVNDPHFALRGLLASDGAVWGSASNVAFYRSPVVDGLLLRAGQVAFRPERLRLYQRLMTQVADDLPYLPLYVRLQWAVARPGVRGLHLDPAGRHRLDRVRVEPPAAPGSPVAPGAAPSGATPAAGVAR
jgi:peptide/nickel transport system substrate-binding protein